MPTLELLVLKLSKKIVALCHHMTCRLIIVANISRRGTRLPFTFYFFDTIFTFLSLIFSNVEYQNMHWFWITWFHLKKRPLFQMKPIIWKIKFIFFRMPRFGWVRNVLRQILSKKAVLDNFYGCGKERLKSLLVDFATHKKKILKSVKNESQEFSCAENDRS